MDEPVNILKGHCMHARCQPSISQHFRRLDRMKKKHE